MPSFLRTGRRFAGALFLALMLALGSGPLGPPHARAADGELAPAKIAVIDVARAERESQAWQDLRTKFEKLLSGYQDEMRQRQRQLEEDGQKLEQQRSILSSEAFADRKRQYDQRVAALQRTAQQRKQALDKVYGKARGQIRRALRDVVLKIAEEREVNLVLNSSPQEQTVIIAYDALSITDEALDRLNARLKTVDMPDASTTQD